MRFALISDIHANWEALSAVADDIRQHQAEEVVCLGDVVGYGADPVGCLTWVAEHCRGIVRGNHEAALLDEHEREQMNPVAAEAIVWTASQVRDKHMEMVNAWPWTILWQDHRLIHSSPEHPERFYYLIHRRDFLNSFRAFSEKMAFYGHTHLPLVAEWNPVSQALAFMPPTELDTKPGRRYLVNVGSVGQPRDGDPRACWVLAEGEPGRESVHLTFRRVDYDCRKAGIKIVEAGLPEILAARLGYGK